MTEIFKGSTSHSVYFELVDSTTGLPKTGILYTDVTGSYIRAGAARTAITMATLASASAAWSSGGFILVDDTNTPGIYRFDVPNAAFATGVDEVIVTVKATGCRTQSRGFTLVDWNKQVAAIPNVAAGASGGLPLSVDASGRVDVLKINGTSQTARDIGASVLLSNGTGTGQVSLSSGLVSLASSQAFNMTGSITGNLSGSVGSVTGNVGGTVATVTTLTNLPSIPAGWLTSTGISAGALNGKGDWSTGSSGDAQEATSQKILKVVQAKA